MKQVCILSIFHENRGSGIADLMGYCKVAGECGVFPVAPQLLLAPWQNHVSEEQKEQALWLGLALLEQSEELWVMGGDIRQKHPETDFAGKHGIPTFYIPSPVERDSYPVSADGNGLLSCGDCVDGSEKEDYEGKLVILRHENLRPECRTPRNQLWVVTHGPGCRPGWKYSPTLHLRHPLDGDSLALARECVWGVAKPETLEKLEGMYPEFRQWREARGINGRDSPDWAETQGEDGEEPSL